MLHLLAFPADRQDLLTLLLQCLGEHDEVVLIDEGLQWLDNRQALGQLANSGARLHALGPVSQDDYVTRIDYPELIAISDRHPASSSWYP